MAWVMVDDITGERIADREGGPTVLAFEGEEYELHLTTRTRADIWEQLRVVLCRARPLHDAPAILPPDQVVADDQSGDEVEGDDPAPSELSESLANLTSDHGPAVHPHELDHEPDALTRAEQLLEQGWTPAEVSRETGLDLVAIRELTREAGRR